ncbi:MAG: hypothetical protein QXN36_05360 [Candidatus Bathyarchaeia archaeon]
MKSRHRISAFTIITMLLLQVLPLTYAAVEFERPHRPIELGDQNVYGVNSDDNASIALGAWLTSYTANDLRYGGSGHDCVRFNVSVMANSRRLDYFEMWDTPYFWIDESDYDQKVVYTGVGDEWGT